MANLMTKKHKKMRAHPLWTTNRSLPWIGEKEEKEEGKKWDRGRASLHGRWTREGEGERRGNQEESEKDQKERGEQERGDNGKKEKVKGNGKIEEEKIHMISSTLFCSNFLDVFSIRKKRKKGIILNTRKTLPFKENFKYIILEVNFVKEKTRKSNLFLIL